MDRAKVKALLESGVLQAYAEGKTIQVDRGYFKLTDKQWEDVASPTFQMPAPCYRVKPEPVERWAVEWESGNITYYLSKKSAEEDFKEMSSTVRMFKM